MDATKAIKLTKTERALLEKADCNPRGTMTSMVWCSTSAKGGNHGFRSQRALLSLVEKGLADNLREYSHRSANRDGWGTTHVDECSANITEAGRKAVEA
jgi:hypothetical protein